MLKLMYVGLKVKVVDGILYGVMLKDYEEQGYLTVIDIDGKRESVTLSKGLYGGCRICVIVENVVPIYDENILRVLEEKKRLMERTEQEVIDIQKFIEYRCKDRC